MSDSASNLPQIQPANPSFNPSSAALLQASCTEVEPTIFRMLRDPSQTIATIQPFVVANPTCVHTVSSQTGWTSLHHLARRADTTLIRFFLDQGAELDAQGHVGETPLMVACEVIDYCFLICSFMQYCLLILILYIIIFLIVLRISLLFSDVV